MLKFQVPLFHCTRRPRHRSFVSVFDELFATRLRPGFSLLVTTVNQGLRGSEDRT